ncbi:proline iminopeptidase [Phtheirospermum japonicum]|uniref:Proline iminopeptidase n=1 Tax=Phtheirospermum japonicum TaxID=374723 RepID=A0A830BWI6_9LAMI|nr:proline iminopeptidase [Phtheirospermum japonicum]
MILLRVATLPPNTPFLPLPFVTPTFPSSNFKTPGRRNLVVLRQSHNLNYYTSDWHVSPETMEQKDLSPEINRTLYPDIEPYNSGFLKVSDIHTVYYEQSGNPDGHAVIFLHGGPGGGTSPSNRKFFDPNFYRIILFDQRGAGKSTPHACLEENTTWDLIEDIEKLRDHLKVPEWLVFGGSWGSTLALAYSESHPDKVTGLVLRGIFLLRKKEIDWFYEGGAAAIFPDAWEPFRDLIPENERGCFVDAYHKRLNSNDKETQVMPVLFTIFETDGTSAFTVLTLLYLEGCEFWLFKRDVCLNKAMLRFYLLFVMLVGVMVDKVGLAVTLGMVVALVLKIGSVYAAARAWTTWELMTAHLLPNEGHVKRGADDEFCLAFARIENHYFVNRGFLPSESYLLDNIEKIRHIKTVIVQGRYDACCPMMSAWDLHKAWPEADFRVVPDAGHSANEPGISEELVAATNKLKSIF